jgi:hypothetical protein
LVFILIFDNFIDQQCYDYTFCKNVLRLNGCFILPFSAEIHIYKKSEPFGRKTFWSKFQPKKQQVFSIMNKNAGFTAF